MRPKVNSQAIVRPDPNESLKRRIFQRLNELARSKDIAVIFHMMQQKDPATKSYESHYQSTGPTGSPDVCLFCGLGLKNPNDFVRLGEFVADPWCNYDFKQDGLGVTFLDRDDHRPDLIIVTIWLPGSLDNAILDLAWGLAAHGISSRRYSISPARLKRETDTRAVKLVREIELQLTSTSYNKKREARLRHARAKGNSSDGPRNLPIRPAAKF
jgi:hypothetical protein